MADAAAKHDVLVLTREVQVGEQIEAGDVRVVSFAWDEGFPAVPGSDVDAGVGEYARYRLASNAVLAPDDLQERQLVTDGRVLMSVSVLGGAIPTGLTADSRVWLLVTIGGACAATNVVVDAAVVAVGRQPAAADGPDRHVALTVEVPPDAVAAVGTADAVSVALWTRDDPPAPPVQHRRARPVLGRSRVSVERRQRARRSADHRQSAMAALRDRRLESGVGRWSEQYLAPYLMTEFLDLVGEGPSIEVGDVLHQTIEHLPLRFADDLHIEARRRRFLIVGGFPELLDVERRDDGRPPAETEADRLLQSQEVLRTDAVERAVYKDIPQSFGVDRPMMLERLLYVLAGQATGILSPQKVCKELGISQPTFDRYLSYLERAFLVFTLPNYSGSETAVQRRGRKVYFIDGAVRNAALQRGLAPLDDPRELGMLMENLVASTLHTLATTSGLRLFHWRDGNVDVDLVLDHPDGPLAFEVGSSRDHSIDGLLALADRHPRFKHRCYLVTPKSRVVLARSAPNGVGTLPLDHLLVAAGRQAEVAPRRRLGLSH